MRKEAWADRAYGFVKQAQSNLVDNNERCSVGLLLIDVSTLQDRPFGRVAFICWCDARIVNTLDFPGAYSIISSRVATHMYLGDQAMNISCVSPLEHLPRILKCSELQLKEAKTVGPAIAKLRKKCMDRNIPVVSLPILQNCAKMLAYVMFLFQIFAQDNYGKWKSDFTGLREWVESSST